MQIENLIEENVVELQEKLSELEKENPDITHRVFGMDEIGAAVEKGKAENETLEEILDAIKRLNRRLDMIFGDHVLINGRFEYINDPNVGQTPR